MSYEKVIYNSSQLMLNYLKVMTIATPWENGVWSAPLYYLYKNRAFWFFSSPDSRHIIGSINSPDMLIASSIFLDDAKFSNIKGLQMRGKIEEGRKFDNMSYNIENLSVALEYIKKFGIKSNSLTNSNKDGFKGSIENPLIFLEKNYRAKLYKFIPLEIIYMDNTIHIGFKQKIDIID